MILKEIKQIQLFCGDAPTDGGKVEIVDNHIYVTADTVSFAEVTWAAEFPKTALFLGDAWERSYGDLCFQPMAHAKHMPWYFAASAEGSSFYCGVKTQPNAFCAWSVTEDAVTLKMDLRCGGRPVQLSGRRLLAASVVTMSGGAYSFDLMKQFCAMLCDHPRLPEKPIYGGNDWYCCYGNNSEDTVLRHAEWIADCAPDGENRPFMVIDDGWQRFHDGQAVENGGYNGGPWEDCNGKFSSMEKVAREIKARNVRPGIWLRPLITMERFDDTAYIKRGGELKVLDPSVPCVIDKVKEDIARIREWGFELIKHDFTTYDVFGRWGYAMTPYVADGDWSFADQKRTSAEIIMSLYAAISAAAGDALILGCNTFGHLCAGLFHAQRTGDDTSGTDFARTLKMGVNTLAFRGAQHGSFYAVDADCVGITEKIPWKYNRKWLELLAKSGTALFVSAAESMDCGEVRAAVREAFAAAAQGTAKIAPRGASVSPTPDLWKDGRGNEWNFCWKE